LKRGGTRRGRRGTQRNYSAHLLMNSAFQKIRIVSYLAPNMFWFYQGVATYLGQILGVETEITQSQYDPLQDPMMLQDQIDMAFICGLPFVQLNRIIPGQLQALVAPVMQASRYQDVPVYFSDMIVKASCDFSFDDLAGKTFCYNDLGSNSGYNLVRYKLMQSQYPSNFFGKVIQSGSHQRSIQLVVEGIADCAAIDSTVLEQQLRFEPKLANHLRVIESIGPCPMPPIVISQRLADHSQKLRSILCQPNTEVSNLMKQAYIRRYVSVQNEDYAPIGRIYDDVMQAGYEILG